MVPSGGRTSLCREVFHERLQIVLGHSLNRLFAERPSLNRLKGSESLDHVLVILPRRLPSVFAISLDETASEHLERHFVSLFVHCLVRDCGCRQTPERAGANLASDSVGQRLRFGLAGNLLAGIPIQAEAIRGATP